MFILHSVEPVSDAHAGAVFCSCGSSLLDQRSRIWDAAKILIFPLVSAVHA
jgi:hypothetical protein